MATRDQKMQVLISALGLDQALALAPSLTDDVTDDAAAKAAAEKAELEQAASKNPFAKGPHFSLSEQGRLYKNPKTRDLAIRLAKAAGVNLSEQPSHRDLNAKGW